MRGFGSLAVWAALCGLQVRSHPRPVCGWLAAPGYQDASYRPIIGRQDLLPDAPRSRRPVASCAGTKRRLFILFVAFDACRETALQVRKSALRVVDSTNTVCVCVSVESWIDDLCFVFLARFQFSPHFSNGPWKAWKARNGQ